MRIIFLGTPEFGIPSLEAIMKSKHELVAIVCQPDKEMDRKGRVIFSPVKEFALVNKLPLFQWEKISRDGIDDLKKLMPDIMITAAYGQILSQEVIDIPKFGIINVHGSLLPKYRGASPVQSAIIDGKTTTGVTIMKTEAGLDSGDIINTETVDIDENETAGELMKKMSAVGAELLLKTLDQIENDTVIYQSQVHVDATFTSKITKKQAYINFAKSAKEIKCQILGMNPEPIAFCNLNNENVNFYRAKIATGVESTNKTFGEVIEPTSAKKGLFIQCNQSVLEVLELQFAGGKVISGKDAINGNRIKIGDVFGASTDIVTK